MSIRFDVATTPLSGVRCVEASAGTGKTFSLAGLYLRLILEQGLDVERILVVTYTNAATSELSGRIRDRLRDAQHAFRTGELRPDVQYLEGLLETLDRDEALARLDMAIRCMDQAAVFTIHGFCQRVLSEFAFEAGQPFQSEVLQDQSDLELEVARDFWRTRVAGGPELVARFAVARKLDPALLARLGSEALRKPLAHIVPPEVAEPDLASTEARCRHALEGVRAAYDRPALEALVLGDDVKGNIYQRKPTRKRLAALDALVHDTAFDLSQPLFDGHEFFTTAKLLYGLKKNAAVMPPALFGAMDTLAETMQELHAQLDTALLRLKSDFCAHVRTEMERRKEQGGLLGFDDMQLQLHASLVRGGGADGPMARAVRARYSAALIDEFQDTDPVQYDIFATLFANRKMADDVDAPPLYLIGDPKQAIYGFRGADVFAYLAARDRADHVAGMDTNWRSTAGLVAAVNTIFSRNAPPFALGRIGFDPVGHRPDPPPPLTVEGESSSPLRVWRLDAPQEGKNADTKAISLGLAREELVRAVAREASRLLTLAEQGLARLGDEPLRAGDMAVLVRSRREGGMVMRELARLSIPCVMAKSGNVLESEAASDLLAVCRAVADPARTGAVRAALATRLLGWNAARIAALDTDAGQDEAALLAEALAAWRTAWVERGVSRFVRAVLDETRVRERVLGQRGDGDREGGERYATDLLHLAELLHGAEQEGRRTPHGLTDWFAARRADGRKRDEYELRLESEDDAVRILTIHGSKGLEFPVVFCPFVFPSGATAQPVARLVHGEGPEYAQRLILERTDPALERVADLEDLAENLRLYYVALTRARQRCYTAWGKVGSSGLSAPAWLLHGPSASDSGNGEESGDAISNGDVDALAGLWGSLTHDEVAEALDGLAAACTDIRVEPLSVPWDGDVPAPLARQAEDDIPVLSCRTAVRDVRRPWRVTSFTSLVADRHEFDPGGLDENIAPDSRAEAPAPRPAIDPLARTIHTLPAGAATGRMLHTLFENLDFPAAQGGELGREVDEVLDGYGFDRVWHEPVAGMVGHVLDAALPATASGEGAVRLGDLVHADRINELEFFLPLARITPSVLAEVYERHGHALPAGFAERLPTLGFQPQGGYLRGFMDLVFRAGGRYYLLDWKSNKLGPTAHDYGPDALRHAMAEECYFLQYHLYTVALDAWLRVRDPAYDYETSFAGVFYVFLRGVDPAAGPMSGIFHDVPDPDFVRDLSDVLTSGEGD